MVYPLQPCPHGLACETFSHIEKLFSLIFACNRKLTLSISKPKISDNQIALHRKSWLYARGMLTVTFTPGLAKVNYAKKDFALP